MLDGHGPFRFGSFFVSFKGPVFWCLCAVSNLGIIGQVYTLELAALPSVLNVPGKIHYAAHHLYGCALVLLGLANKNG